MESYLKLSKTNIIQFLSSKSNQIATSTINSKNNLRLVQIDSLEMTIDKTNVKFNKPYLAISTSNSFKNTNYQALLSPLFL